MTGSLANAAASAAAIGPWSDRLAGRTRIAAGDASPSARLQAQCVLDVARLARGGLDRAARQPELDAATAVRRARAAAGIDARAGDRRARVADPELHGRGVAL